MAFLDIVKKGVSDAGTKAKNLVESNRLKMQITQKEKDIDEIFRNIGRIIFQSSQNKDLPDIEETVKGYCKDVLKAKHEILSFEESINQLNDEKLCVCGKTVPKDTCFCSFCGNQFPVEAINPKSEVETDQVLTICNECHFAVKNSKFCSNCGNLINQ